MLNVTIIVGLPASGKTTYIENHLKGAKVFDDFHKDAKNNSPFFEMSINYLPLIRALLNGGKCVIADVEFCRPGNLDIVVQKLKEIEVIFNLNIEIDHLFFENDAKKCKINALERGRAHHPEELAKIEELTKIYRIPEGAKIIRIETKAQ